MFEVLESLFADVIVNAWIKRGSESPVDRLDLVVIRGRLLPVGVEGAVHLQSSRGEGAYDGGDGGQVTISKRVYS